ncbi:MAG TPA: 50S ribosomal protein L24 [Candidatus Paceibacterota bacterium]|nr:50S ribosomal protein L24 [Candidatus Paceibacterota bacterium]
MSKATAGRQTAKFKIKKGDQVVVISGKDKGKTGKVTQVIPEDAKVVVDGIALVKRHIRKTGAKQSGRIVERPRAIHISNVMLEDPKEKKGTRVRRQLVEGKRTRVAVKSGTTLA